MDKNTLTSRNIEKIQILATMDDGSHIMTVSDNKALIDIIVGTCKFVKLKDDIFEQCSLKEIIDK